MSIIEGVLYTIIDNNRGTRGIAVSGLSLFCAESEHVQVSGPQSTARSPGLVRVALAV